MYIWHIDTLGRGLRFFLRIWVIGADIDAGVSAKRSRGGDGKRSSPGPVIRMIQWSFANAQLRRPMFQIYKEGMGRIGAPSASK